MAKVREMGSRAVVAVLAGTLAALSLVAPGNAAPSAPSLSISPDSGRLGDRVTAHVVGFAPGRVVRIYLRDRAPAGTCVTGPVGSCDAAVVVPSGPGGRYPIVARAAAVAATAHFTKTPSLYASPFHATVGTRLNVWPVGFKPHEGVAVTLDGHVAGWCSTDEWGDCTVALITTITSTGSQHLLARGLASGLFAKAKVVAHSGD